MAAGPNVARGTFVDRLIAAVSPRWAVSRARGRIALDALRAYEAASPKDLWRPRRSGASASADHMADAAKLRAKARYLTQNVPYVAAAIDADVATVVGTGILPRFLGPNEKKLNELLARWMPVCDADGLLDFLGLVALAYRCMRVDGEVLVRFRPRRPEDGLPVPLQIQLLEIDYLDSAKNTGAGAMGGGRDGVPPGNEVIEGIEYDAIGRVAAYWLFPMHPGDTSVRVRSGAGQQSRRVSAEFIVHLFKPERAGQRRGITALAPAIVRTRDTQLLEDAELARKNLESRLSVLVSGDASQLANPPQLGATNPDQASPSTAQRTGDLGPLASGGITQLPPGMMPPTVVAPVPTPGHVDNIKWHVHLVCAALNVAYESATGDMSGVNYSSARVRRLDVRRHAEQMQWLLLMPRLIRPIMQRLVETAELAGLVPDARYTLDASTPRWEHVDPGKEVDAELKEIAGGLQSISESLRRRGYKPEDVFAEIKADFDRLKKDGTLDVLFFLLKGKTDEAPPPAAKSAAKAERDAALGADGAAP